MNLFKIFFISIFAVSLYASTDIIASVNGENISVKDVAMILKKERLTKQEMLQNKQGYTQLINKIIDEKLIEQNILQNNLITDQDIKTELTMLSLQTVYKKYRSNLLSKTSVSDKEIADFYAANQAKMKSAAQYKTLYISLNSNSIAEKDLLNDIKNAPDKKQAMIRANAREKTLTKSMFPDDNSFSKLSTLKKGDVSNELVKIGNQYYIFYILDKQEAKNLTLEQASNGLKNIILKNKVEKQLQDIVKQMKQKDTISFDDDGFPTIAGIKWNNHLINLFFKDQIAKLPKVEKKGNAFYPYTQLEESAQKQLINSMEYITYIYAYAYENNFKNNKNYIQFIEKAKKPLKVQKWKENLISKARVNKDTKFDFLMQKYHLSRDEAMLKYYGNSKVLDRQYDFSYQGLKKWKAQNKMQEITTSLRTNSNIKIFLDKDYTPADKTAKKDISVVKNTSNTEILKCIKIGEKEFKKQATPKEQMELYNVCLRKQFDSFEVKKECLKYFKSDKAKKEKIYKNGFCDIYL